MKVKKQASSIDITLEKHVDSLKTTTLYRLQELQKKMISAEKRKFSDQQRQIHAFKEKLFPKNGLQERQTTCFIIMPNGETHSSKNYMIIH